jgi:hypothetical protein
MTPVPLHRYRIPSRIWSARIIKASALEDSGPYNRIFLRWLESVRQTTR